MTNSKTQRPARHGSFHNNPPKPPRLPAARKAAETKGTTKHHAAVCHKHAGGGKLDGGEGK